MEILHGRETLNYSKRLAEQYFGRVLYDNCFYDYQFIDIDYRNIIVIGGFTYQIPAFKEIYKNEIAGKFLNQLQKDKSHLLQIEWDKKQIDYYICSQGNISKNEIDEDIQQIILQILSDYTSWAGYLNDNGDHIIDLKTPSPGPHFSTNMLLGNRMGYSHPLQTTPKSVVDRYGGGSFRSHAAVQVLATRWDMLPEENGFPANRQFYLMEDGKQIFYSANASDKNIKSAKCRHSTNYSEIEYITECGLQIKRRIFILPQYDGLPVATEVQRISISNKSGRKRNLKIVMTGMLGSPVPKAFMEDVLYTTIIMESGMIRDDDGNFLAYVPHYYPEFCRNDIRFMAGMFYEKGKKLYPEEIGTNYGDFIGNGNIYYPQGLMKLTSKLSTRGPAFIALGKNFSLDADEEILADQYAGLISSFDQEKPVPDEVVLEEIQALHNKFQDKEVLDKVFEEHQVWYSNYKCYLTVRTNNENFDKYVNNNLPFQILYQSFVSRSFDLTQKGYREIGLREIQDIYASMYYFFSMGEAGFVKELLIQWIEKVLEGGYCYHNFFWVGKEAGKWSDDGLWLVQAVYRYVEYTKDYEFLNELHEIPETGGKKRSVYDTLKAIINYSGRISTGLHGLPLIDFADWNDCLKVDPDYLSAKDKLNKTVPKDRYSESVMNGFLLKLAMLYMKEVAGRLSDYEYAAELDEQLASLSHSLQTHGWKDDFFARVLFNRFGNEITYLGAGKDGFSGDPNIDGTYFLNSFSWSVLSGEATENQIEIMLDNIEKYLKKPYGFALMSPTDLSKVSKVTATGEYFPGDRENGAIFKHASMMAATAMIKAAKEITDRRLSEKLIEFAYWMIELVLPYNTLKNPYVNCGNPRWCTQYINSNTGEHIGPTLSGTATWLALALFEMLGISYHGNKLIINPMLSKYEEHIEYTLRYLDSFYFISIRKPKGLYRIKDNKCILTLDNEVLTDNIITLEDDKKHHYINLTFV